MNREDKIKLLKEADVEVPENATEEELDTIIEENSEVIEDVETTEEVETEKGITMTELKSIVKNTIKENMNEITKKSISVKTEADIKNEKAEKGAKFIKDLINGNLDTKAIDSTSGSFGYTVPTEVADYILEKRDKISKMRKYAFVFSMAGTFQLPTEGTAVTSYWVGENAEITESNPTTGRQTLNDYYLATRVLMPRKLLNTSSTNIINYISNLSARSIVSTEETAFMAGDGSSKPTGLRLASMGTVAQVGAKLEYDDLVNLYFTLGEQYRANSVFLTSTAGMKLIRKLKDNDNLPIFDTNVGTIFGRPLIESTDIPSNLGTGGNETEIIFGDLSYYWIKDGESMFMDTDKVISKLQIELVVAEAIDGICTLTDAFKKLTGVK
jgi:HK97 family phage major capsid protein